MDNYELDHEQLFDLRINAMSKQERIEAALTDLQDGKFNSQRQAAQRYGISKSTLNDRKLGKHSNPTGNTLFTKAEELMLVVLLDHMAKIGFGCNRAEVKQIVNNYLVESNQTNLFTKGTVTDCWYYGFMHRHGDKLSFRTANNTEAKRAEASKKEIFDRWYKELGEIYDKYGFHTKPMHIFNCDESGLQCLSGNSKIVCGKSNLHPRRITANNEKKTYTILACCNAYGTFLPVHFIHKGARIMSSWFNGAPVNATFDVSESGWMESEQFYNWFSKVFVSHCNKMDDEYKLLFLDGHASHISLKLIECAKQNKIILFRLPAHTSHLIQPLDVGVFRTVKTKWREALNAYLKTSTNISKDRFSMLMASVVKHGFLSDNARAGFEKCGLFPLNRDKIVDQHINTVFCTPVASSSNTPVASSSNTPFRSVTSKRRNNLLQELDNLVDNRFNITKSDWENALTKIIQKEKTDLNRHNTQVKGNCLTSEDVINQLEAKEAQNNNKIAELAERAKKRKEATEKRNEATEKRKQAAAVRKPRAKKAKIDQENNPVIIPDTITEIPNTIPSWQTSQTNSLMVCDCGMEYDKDNLRNQWMSCEGRCGKWFCSNCSMFMTRFDCVTNMNIFECNCI